MLHSRMLHAPPSLYYSSSFVRRRPPPLPISTRRRRPPPIPSTPPHCKPGIGDGSRHCTRSGASMMPSSTKICSSCCVRLSPSQSTSSQQQGHQGSCEDRMHDTCMHGAFECDSRVARIRGVKQSQTCN
jgi:hypothetical protein